jgi:hypothetical protein
MKPASFALRVLMKVASKSEMTIPVGTTIAANARPTPIDFQNRASSSTYW